MQLSRVLTCAVVVVAACGDDRRESPSDTGFTAAIVSADTVARCTAVKMVSPTSGSQQSIDKPVALKAAATCPAGTGQYQFWVKPNGAPNWTMLGVFSTSDTSSWTAPSQGAWNITAVARSSGSGTSFDVRASSITINITGPIAPTAVNDTLTATMSTPATINVTANDIDPTGKGLTVTGETQPSHGSVSMAGTVATYTPTPGYSGSDSFMYTISNSSGFSSTATVSITVQAVTPSCTISISGPDTGVIGAPVSLTAVASCNVGNPEIQWSSQLPGHDPSVFQPFSTQTTASFDTSNTTPGDNQFTALVRSQGTTPTFASNTIDVTISDDVPPCTAVSVTAPTNGAVFPPGQAITLQASATCPAGVSPEFQFRVMQSGDQSWTVLPGFVTGPSSFTPTATGGWAISAVARSIGSHVAFQVQSAPVNITVTNAPQAVDDTLTLDEDTTGTVNVLANDSDPNGLALSAAIASGPASGTASIDATGVLTYTPAANYNGTDSIVYTASDSSGGTATATVHITVNPVNDPPVAVDDQLATAEDTSASFDPTQNDSDVDGDSVVVTAVGAPANGTATFTGNIVTYTPAPNFNGSDSFSYTISDGHGGTASATIFVAISAVNDPPVAVDDQLTTPEDTAGSVYLLGNDTDPDGEIPTVVAFDQPQHGSVSVMGGFASYQPAPNYNGPDSFTYTIQDSSGATSTATVFITVLPVNDPPVAVNDAATLDEDTSVTIDVVANDSDVDGDTLAIASVTQPAGGTVAIISGHEVTYTPAPNFNGTDSFTYTIADPSGATATATVTLTVNPVNDPPVAVDDAATLDEDTTATIDVVANDSDVDGDALTVTAVTQPGHGSVAIVDAAHVAYTPDANYNGTDSFRYTISDGNGGEASAAVTLTINPVNDPPVAVDDAATLDEDTSVTVDVVGNDSDVDGDALSIAAITQPAHGVAEITDATHVTYTPASNYNGSDSFTYTISDGNRGQASATVVLTINPVNDPPVAVNDAASLYEDTSVVINVLANDSDVDGDPLAIAAVTPAAHGSVTILDAGHVQYTPAANFNGSDAFTYTIVDPSGAAATAAVLITVISVNDPPVAVDDAASLDEDTAVTVDVVANDSDVDGDALTITAITQPAHGTAMIVDAHHISYVPLANYHGPDALGYTISDGNGGTAMATLSLTVISVNDAPVAVNDAATLDEDTSVTVDVVANDSDVDGDALTIVSITPAAHGTAAIVDAHHVSYAPAANYNGSDSFTYTISDGNGGQATASVALTITPVNDPPVAVGDAATLDEDTVATIDVVANDSDVDGDTLTVTAITQPGHGTAAIVDAHHVSYTPAANYNGSDSFTYTISDGNGGQATATVALTITPVNDPPVASDVAVSTFNDTPAVVTLVATDVDGDALSFAIASGPAHGTLGAIAGNQLTYTPAAGFVGSDAFTYTAFDGQASSAAANVTITITRSVCGNGVREGREECDDGNTQAGDGCEPSCTLTCGSGTGAERSTVDPASGHCFAAYDGIKHSYQDAAAMCTGVSGHLPTITSASEDEAAFSAVRTGDHPWLGGDDIATPGAFNWITGEPFGYSNVAGAKPDTDKADCLQYLADGTWSDAACGGSTAVGTLCEIEVATATQSFSSGGSGTRAVAVADLNGDGYLDVAAVNQGSNTVGILLGDGAGGFALQATYATGAGPVAIAAGDFDGDGQLDLAVVNASASTVSILHGAPGGSFTAGPTVAIASGATSIAAGDLDGDGVVDLVIGASGTVQLLHGNGSGGFSVKSSLSLTGAVAAIAAGDFDHDGRLDLAITTPTAVLVVLSSGGGLLGLPVSIATTSNNRAVTAADFDGDGNLDLAVVNGTASITVLFGTASGSFGNATTLAPPGTPQLVAAGDFDGDGAIDLVALTGNYATLFRGAGRTFSQAASVAAGGSGASFAVAAKVNADAAADLIVANTSTSTVGLLFGGPQGLTGGRALPVGTAIASTVTADFNGDGRPDLAVVDPSAGKVTVFVQTATGGLTQTSVITTNASAGSTYAAVADFDGDGKLDLAIVNINFSSIGIALGAGDGTFSAPTNAGVARSPQRIAIGDFNGDGKPDIAVPAAAGGVVSILVNTGGGHFGRGTDVTITGTPSAVVVADFTGDKRLDLAVATSDQAAIALVAGNGDSTFQAPVTFAIAAGSPSIAAGDLNGDGNLDLVAATPSTSGVSILAGNGKGFAAATSAAVGAQPSSVVVVDLDGDGRLDILTGNAGTSDVTVLHASATGFVASSLALGVAPSWITVADLDHDGHLDITASSGNPFITTLYSPR